MGSHGQSEQGKQQPKTSVVGGAELKPLEWPSRRLEAYDPPNRLLIAEVNPKLRKQHKEKSKEKGFLQSRGKCLLIGGHCQIKRSLTKAYVSLFPLCIIFSLPCHVLLTAVFYQPKLESEFLKILHSYLLTLSAEH